MSTTEQKYSLHLGIAERGKLYCLEGKYKESLRHFREAIRMTQSQPGGEIFFQHYSQCVMEALELSGAHNEVIDYCEKFVEFLEQKDDTSSLVQRYYGMILEKMAIQYLLKEDKSEAKGLLAEVQKRVGRGQQPITDELLNWIQRGYSINKKLVVDLQKKHNYFIVRKDKVNKDIAMDLPQGVAPF